MPSNPADGPDFSGKIETECGASAGQFEMTTNSPTPPMVLQHFLLTRFSYRGTLGGAWHTSSRNPLEPKRLKIRFKLFEAFCLPSILHQTIQDFTWIIMVDAALGAAYRSRLQAMVSGLKHVVILDYAPEFNLVGLGWLSRYIKPETTHVATTIVDDDDLIYDGLVEYVHAYLKTLYRDGRANDCHIVGCGDFVQWDFLPMRKAPLGFLKPWHRGRYPTNAGYTLFCKYPEYDVCVLGFLHTRGGGYFEPDTQIHDNALSRLRECAERSRRDWRSWNSSDHFHLVETNHPQVVILNHLYNDQETRLFEAWSSRRVVRGPEDFVRMHMPFDDLPALLRPFRRSLTALLRYDARAVAIFRSRHYRTMYWVIFVLTSPVWFVTGLPSWAHRWRKPGGSHRDPGTRRR